MFNVVTFVHGGDGCSSRWANKQHMFEAFLRLSLCLVVTVGAILCHYFVANPTSGQSGVGDSPLGLLSRIRRWQSSAPLLLSELLKIRVQVGKVVRL